MLYSLLLRRSVRESERSQGQSACSDESCKESMWQNHIQITFKAFVAAQAAFQINVLLSARSLVPLYKAALACQRAVHTYPRLGVP